MTAEAPGQFGFKTPGLEDPTVLYNSILSFHKNRALKSFFPLSSDTAVSRRHYGLPDVFILAV